MRVCGKAGVLVRSPSFAKATEDGSSLAKTAKAMEDGVSVAKAVGNMEGWGEGLGAVAGGVGAF